MGSFPFFQQRDAADCGPSCLWMISKFYGKNYSIEYLRAKSYITNTGVSLLGLSDAAEFIGYQTQGAQLSWDQLKNDVPLPCIVHWRDKHFVVVFKIKSSSLFRKTNKETVYIADPAQGILKYQKDEFLCNWISNGKSLGVSLLLAPSPRFYDTDPAASANKGLAVPYLLRYLHPYSRYLLHLLLGLLIGVLINMAFPFLTQSIVDYGISNRDMSFVLIILMAQLVLNIGQTANSLIQSWISLHVTSRVSIKFIADFLAKLMRLPIHFFYSRTIGDIMQRIGDQNRIQTFITGSLINVIFGVITLITYSIVMLNYDVKILAVFYLGAVLYLLWVTFFLKKRSELDYKRFNELAKNQSNLVELITGIQEIRSAGAEKQKRWDWERVQTKLFKVSLSSLSLSQTQVLGAAFIDNTKNIIISFIAAQSVIEGKMTLGAMMATQFILGQLNTPINQFVGFIQSAQDAKLSINRLNEVYSQDDEDAAVNNTISEIPASCSIQIRNLSFQFEGPHSEKVLNNLTFTIPSGKTTAIVGASGSGKTTILKILLGIHSPTEGDILLNGIPFKNFNINNWRKSISVVMQDGFIFSDTIANNISLGDDYPDFEQVIKAAEIANIKDFIEALPLGYGTPIGNQGHGLSGGQRQRLLIARALYRKTEFLFFDEATNSLDTKNEMIISENLNKIFSNRTTLFIAHRLSTVKHADQILVLDKGSIVEKGNHQELLEVKGIYAALVENQL